VIVVVIGVHRSGTSMLAGILDKLGISMGPNVKANAQQAKHNALGYYEDNSFMDLNERILTRSNRGWADVPDPLKLGNACASFQGPALELIQARMAANEMWGWKDPRTCLTLPAYFGGLDKDHTLIVRMERSKLAIVKSLLHREARHGMNETLASNLVDSYGAHATVNTARFQKTVVFQYSDFMTASKITMSALVHTLNQCEYEPTSNQITDAIAHIRQDLNHHGI
jgi:hypothetical protein